MSIEQMLDGRKDLQKFLYRRAFLLSKESFADRISQFPFYGNWKTEKIGTFHFMVHNLMKVYHHTVGERTFFLFGHCYNPFTMEHEESRQLAYIAEAFGSEEFQNRIDELTGIFVFGWFDQEQIRFITDPSGMQSAYYGVVEGNFMLTSHAQLIGDLYGLKMTELTRELLNYKWYYRVMGPYLPGDLSPFDEVKRVVPNISFSYNFSKPGNSVVDSRRFYPLRDLKECQTEQEYDQTIRAAADILKHGAELILKKWQRPAISLTGGIDSNTTFAAANGHYGEFETFSYLSANKESIDVEAAKKIAARFRTKHTVYNIPDQNTEVADLDAKAAIITHSSGYIHPLRPNEMRKRIYLEENCPYGVEVKSWVSETIRAYWYKHYGRKTMPGLSPKLFRNLYKIFILNRSLAHKIDRVFAEYIEKFEYHKIPAQYPPADMHYNEMTWGSWGGSNISEMKYCFDITIIYNNRKFLDLLFKVPLEKRISDQHHLDMKKYLNQELYDMNIRIVNQKETGTRAFLLNIVFTLNNYLPF